MHLKNYLYVYEAPIILTRGSWDASWAWFSPIPNDHWLQSPLITFQQFRLRLANRNSRNRLGTRRLCTALFSFYLRRFEGQCLAEAYVEMIVGKHTHAFDFYLSVLCFVFALGTLTLKRATSSTTLALSVEKKRFAAVGDKGLIGGFGCACCEGRRGDAFDGST